MRIVVNWKKYAKALAVNAAIAAFLAFINPYGATGTLSYPLALAYWLAMIIIGGLGADLSMLLYQKLLPNGPVLGRLAIGAAVASVCVTALIITIEVLYNDGFPAKHWPILYGLVMVISLAVTGIGYISDLAFGDDETSQAADSASIEAKFLQRLPRKFHAAELYAIASEDHYLRIYTNIGDELILLRLADAVRELDGANGLQVHRSWWVAGAGIIDEKRDNGRRILILKSGAEVPVSRSFQSAAKAAGLLV